MCYADLVQVFFSWNSKKQETVAQSTATASVVNQILWLRKLMADLGFDQRESTKITCDNQSAVTIAKNPVFHGRTKHFKIKYHFVKEVQQEGEIILNHCKSDEQLADILPKALPKFRFEELRKKSVSVGR